MTTLNLALFKASTNSLLLLLLLLFFVVVARGCLGPGVDHLYFFDASAHQPVIGILVWATNTQVNDNIFQFFVVVDGTCEYRQ